MPGAKRLDATVHSHVKSAEIETVEPSSQSVEALFQRRGEHPSAIEEHGPATMSAELHQRKRFTVGWHAQQLVAMPFAIQSCGADRPLVVQNQLLQRPSAIADHGGELLFSDREDAPVWL